MLNVKATIEVLKKTDTELLRECKTVNYQASGPGGQKRNRKLSAVRLSHIKSNIAVTASEFRETHRNLDIAVSKLRLEIALKVKISESNDDIDLLDSLIFQNDISDKKHAFAFSVLKAFYYFKLNSASVRATSERLMISSPKLIKFLKKNKQVWQETQETRKAFSHNPLK
jgi:hypothetical protein